MSRNIENRMINNSIATVIEKTNQKFRYYMQKLKRVYINTPIIIEEPAHVLSSDVIIYDQ